jgi:hypothetical protein
LFYLIKNTKKNKIKKIKKAHYCGLLSKLASRRGADVKMAIKPINKAFIVFELTVGT